MTFYFYDLETSGINSRAQRIMQFAGQRTDEDFNLIGEPQNWLIKLTDEVLPDPEAVLLTGITPQKTIEEGYSEAEFLKLFFEQVCQPDTVIVGFNNVRFDDEFMRNTLWRNFYDAYEWQWQDGRSRWDILDVVRMVRALRPDGIQWPFDENKQPTNRLELLTKLNNLDHDHAHDALNDVLATIAVAKLIKQKQPKMFAYLLGARSKKAIARLLTTGEPQPFLYTSGRYSNKWLKTTAVVPIAEAEHGSVLVYDLRVDPVELAKLSDDALSERVFSRDSLENLPVKVIKPNACPAVAPLGVLDHASEERLNLTLKEIQTNLTKLFSIKDFIQRLEQLYQQRTEKIRSRYTTSEDPEFQLYDGFLPDRDKTELRALRVADENTLADFEPDFVDERLSQLLPRYKARNFPRSLSKSEAGVWEEYRQQRIMNGLPGQLSLASFAKKLDDLSTQSMSEDKQFILQELRLYAENLAPLE